MAENPEARIAELREFVRAVDPDLHREFEFRVEDVAESGAGPGIYTIKGHAAVFNRWSLDLGGFRERVKTGAFDEVLSRDPHVLHTWDHDTAKTLSSTRSKKYPLELSLDPRGLRFFSKPAPTTYAEDLRVLLDGDVIDQASFAFTVAKDEWRIIEEGGEERVERSIVEVGELLDVTTCAMGAYPATDSVLAVRSLALGQRPVIRIPEIPTVEQAVERGERALAEQTEEIAPEEASAEPTTPQEERTEARADEPNPLDVVEEVAAQTPGPDEPVAPAERTPEELVAAERAEVEREELVAAAERERIAYDLAERDARAYAVKQAQRESREALVAAKQEQLAFQRGKQ